MRKKEEGETPDPREVGCSTQPPLRVFISYVCIRRRRKKEEGGRRRDPRHKRDGMDDSTRFEGLYKLCIYKKEEEGGRRKKERHQTKNR